MRLLIPLDGSRFSEEVLEAAGKVARGRDVEVTLLTVIPEAVHEFPPAGSPMAEERAAGEAPPGEDTQSYLARVARSSFPQGARVRVVHAEDAAAGIIDFARREETGLIAMATHGRTGLGRMVMGSVADAVLRSGVAPVIMVRPTGLREP